MISERGFSLELSRKHITSMFYNAEMESELSEGVHIRKDATFFRSDMYSDRDGLMSKIQNDHLFKPYPHDQSSMCQNIGRVIVMYYM